MNRTKRSITSGLLLFFTCTFCVIESTVAQTISIPRPTIESQDATIYTGEIQIPGMGGLEITFTFIESEVGTQTLMTVPAQAVQDAPLNTAFGKDGELIASLAEAGLKFTIRNFDGQDSLIAEMQQGAFETTIALEKIDAMPEMKRPQHPVEPYPYETREVVSMHPDGTHVLAGTLTVPEGDEPFPCAILITGSGQQDRDETVFGHKPFLVIADWLTQNGIAVLRYDDRGIGGSVMKQPEELANITSRTNADDVAVIVQAARMHPEIDDRRIGLIGHSEGGLIAPMVAVDDQDIAFIVMLAGTGMSGIDLLPLQQTLILRASGASEELIERQVSVTLNVFELVVQGASDEELSEHIDELLLIAGEHTGQSLDDFTDEDRAAILAEMTSPWLRYFLAHEPLITLSQVECPVLAVNGTLDLQVPCTENLSLIEEVMNNAMRDITIIEFEGLNHLFQPAETGSPDEYFSIETTFDESVLHAMTDWIQDVTDE
ncbi:MAG: alpha/beta fold hydrolase [Planctomycetota bacterium]|nr:alpha/beta fold hydrolase [Planctomycetota bacterium]